MRPTAAVLAMSCVLCFGSLKAQQASSTRFQQISSGLVLHLYTPAGQPRLVHIRFWSPRVVEVIKSPEDSLLYQPDLIQVSQDTAAVSLALQFRDSLLVLSSDSLKLRIRLQDGRLSFYNARGRLLLAESPCGEAPFQARRNPAGSYILCQGFRSPGPEALYGLGENQYGWLNLRGRDLLMAQHNTEAFVPYLVSTAGYGLLWKNASVTRYGDPRAYQPLSRLRLYDSSGRPGALSARYQPPKGPALLRRERDLDYGDLSSLARLPAGFPLDRGTVVYSGYLQDSLSGPHRFRLLYGGHLKVYWQDSLVLDAWRECWNPDQEALSFPMQAGRRYHLRIEWEPQGSQSFLSLRWQSPDRPLAPDGYAFRSQAGRDIDYCVVQGSSLDSLVAGYRQLSGRAPLLPRWALGFWQSREHYASQREILDVAARYRQLGIPLDNLVQDWYYWKKDRWGSQYFDSSRYPDPAGMIDTLHRICHLHFMLSVWPKFYTAAPDFRRFWDSGYLYRSNILDGVKDWVGYESTFYDAFNPQARHAFWKLVDRRLLPLGVDAWWMDASEPDIRSNASLKKRQQLMEPLYLGSPLSWFNAYALENDRCFFEGQRRALPDRRVFILTRSAFAGAQRYGAATWSGDIGSSFRDFREQIAAGLNFSLSGIPYWTTDIGGFAPPPRFQHPAGRALADWQELNLRWFQFGAFCPLFRSHGEYPLRELYNLAPVGSAVYRSLLYYDRLRYRLLPYLYSLAYEVYRRHYTLMRALAMDFPNDPRCWNEADAYLLGPSLLVAPVTRKGARSRPLYLPAGAGWYDLYSGQYQAGGRSLQVPAPLNRIPVFVKAGAIVPIGRAQQYSGEKPLDTLQLWIYTGADARFSLYQDQGSTLEYLNGERSLIPISYRQRGTLLRIGPRKGSYPGMVPDIELEIHWISPDHPEALDVHSPADQQVLYQGRPLLLQKPGGPA